MSINRPMSKFLLLSSLVCLSFSSHAGPVDTDAALALIKNTKPILIDVRTAPEFAQGSLPNAVQIEYQKTAEIMALVPDKNSPIILYCRSGNRSSQAQDALQKMGYTKVINAGGFNQLKNIWPVKNASRTR